MNVVKYTINDLKKFSFKGKNRKEKNLSGKIDEILYLGTGERNYSLATLDKDLIKAAKKHFSKH